MPWTQRPGVLPGQFALLASMALVAPKKVALGEEGLSTYTPASLVGPMTAASGDIRRAWV